MPHRYSLAARLAPFVEAGLVPRLPTAMQVRQGELQVLPYGIRGGPTNPPLHKQAFPEDPKFWIDNGDKLAERWTKWSGTK